MAGRAAAVAATLLVLLSVAAQTAHAKIYTSRVDLSSRGLVPLTESFGFADGGQLIFTLKDLHLYREHDGSKEQDAAINLSKFGLFLAAMDAGIEQDFAFQEECILDSLEANDLPRFSDSAIRRVKEAKADSATFEFTCPGGLYALYFASCDPDTLVTFTMHIEMFNIDARGHKDYLSVGQAELETLYWIMFSFFFLGAAAWSWLVYKQRSHAQHIHYLMAALAIAKTLTLLSQACMVHFVERTGSADGWNIVYYIFTFFRGMLFFSVVVLIGTGWSYMKPFLGDREKRILMVVVPLQVFANIAIVVMDEESPSALDWFTWRDIFHLVDIICCCAILFPIVWSIKSLRDSSQTDGKAARSLEKLSLFRNFYVVVVCYIYFTRIIVYLIHTTVDYRYEWVSDAASEMATLAFYVWTAVNFQPTESNPYLKLSDGEKEMTMCEQPAKLSGTEVLVLRLQQAASYVSTTLNVRRLTEMLGATATLTPSSQPVWLLGTRYDVAGREGEQAFDATRHDFASRIWCTYRRGFPALGDAGFTSDVGWGCTLRSGQMLVAEALSRHLLGREWRRDSDGPVPPDLTSILSLLQDSAEEAAPLSIHSLCKAGKEQGVLPGRWLGPWTLCKSLEVALRSTRPAGLQVHVVCDPGGGAPTLDVQRIRQQAFGQAPAVEARAQAPAACESNKQQELEEGQQGSGQAGCSCPRPHGGEQAAVVSGTNTHAGPAHLHSQAAATACASTGEMEQPTQLDGAEASALDAHRHSVYSNLAQAARAGGEAGITASEGLDEGTGRSMNTPPGRDADLTCSSYDNLAGEELGAAPQQPGPLSSDGQRTQVSSQAAAQAGGPLLLLIPLTLGMGKVNPLYLPQLKQALTFPHSVGIVGGRPGSSLYFIGHHEDRLLYLDPHDTQSVLPLPAAVSTYFCGAVRLMPMAAMDPSLAIGFLCSSQVEFDDLCCRLQQLSAEYAAAPLLTVALTSAASACLDQYGEFEDDFCDRVEALGSSSDEGELAEAPALSAQPESTVEQDLVAASAQVGAGVEDEQAVSSPAAKVGSGAEVERKTPGKREEWEVV